MFISYQVKGVADALKTNLEKGIHGDNADLLKRKSAFGSNTYPPKRGKSLWVTYFVLESVFVVNFFKVFFD